LEIELKIKELRNGMKRLDIEGKVTDKSETREVTSRFKNETYKVASAVIADETGTIKLTLWNEQIDQVNVGNIVKIENGYVSSFRGEIQLNIGKFGKLTVE
jgi:replication factor A1